MTESVAVETLDTVGLAIAREVVQTPTLEANNTAV